MEFFNNREIAILVWCSLLIIWALSNQKFRNGLIAVIRAAVTKPLLKIYGAMTLYVSLVVYMLNSIGIWDISQLKTTIIWIFSIALISALRSDRIMYDPAYFKRAVHDNINLIIVLEFILGFYTFPLVVELFIVPVGTVLGILKAFAENKEEYRPVEKLIDALFIVIGLIVIIYAAYKLWIGFDTFATRQSFQDFYTPPLLSLLFLPFLYGLSVLLVYERTFLKLKNNSSDEMIYQFARRRAILNFLLRTRQLERWSKATFFKRLNSIEDVLESIADFKSMIAYESNPKDILPDEGWQPQLAKDFMEEHGLKTNYYDRLYDDEWFASSNYLELDNGILPNNIAYYVSGNLFAAKSLKLKLNVNEPEKSEAANRRFIDLSEALLEKALSMPISTNLAELIHDGRNAKTEIEGRIVSVTREDWHAGNTGQYEIVIEVLMASYERPY